MAVNGVNNNSSSVVSNSPQGAKNSQETQATERVAAKTAANAYAAQGARPTISDAANVQISPRAREMAQAKKIVDETPDVREDKVAHFKELIAKGEYKADAGKIADGILSEAIREELSKNPAATRE